MLLMLKVATFTNFLSVPALRSPQRNKRIRRSGSHYSNGGKFRLFFLRWISVGEGVPSPRPRIQVVHGTVPQKCARNTLPAQSDILCRPEHGGLRCRPLRTSSTRAPEVTPN